MCHSTGFTKDEIIDLCAMVCSAGQGPGLNHWPPVLGLFKAELAETYGVSQRAVTGCPARSRSMRPTSAARSPVCGAGGSAARRSSPGSPWRFASRRASAAAGWRRSMTPAVTRWARSSPRTSSQGRRSSLTAGPLTGPSAARDISTGPSTRKRPAPLGRTRTACCPESIGSPRCASGGCWAPARARLTPRTCPPISDELVFRFNRRRSASRGMVFYRVLQLRRATPARVCGSARQQKATPCEASRGRHGTPSEPRAPGGGPPVADRPESSCSFQSG